MPTYDYLCNVCQKTFEFEQSITDVPLKECPRCLTATMKRMISPNTQFVLKGDCWAKDLYGKNEKT